MNDKTKAGLKIGGGCVLAVAGVLAGLFGPKLFGDGQNEWEQAKVKAKAIEETKEGIQEALKAPIM